MENKRNQFSLRSVTGYYLSPGHETFTFRPFTGETQRTPRDFATFRLALFTTFFTAHHSNSECFFCSCRCPWRVLINKRNLLSISKRYCVLCPTRVVRCSDLHGSAASLHLPGDTGAARDRSGLRAHGGGWARGAAARCVACARALIGAMCPRGTQ